MNGRLEETRKLCRDIAEMAQRVGMRFVPDKKKIDEFEARRLALSDKERE